MAENSGQTPPTHQVNISNLIKYFGVFLTLASALVTVTAFVVKTSFPSDAATEALRISKENEVKYDSLIHGYELTNAGNRLTKLEVQYSNSLDNQKQIRQQLDKITDIMMDIKRGQ